MEIRHCSEMITLIDARLHGILAKAAASKQAGPGLAVSHVGSLPSQSVNEG